MRIVVLNGRTLNPGDNPWTGVEQLGYLTVYDKTPDDQILDRGADAQIILTNKTPLTAHPRDCGSGRFAIQSEPGKI